MNQDSFLFRRGGVVVIWTVIHTRYDLNCHEHTSKNPQRLLTYFILVFFDTSFSFRMSQISLITCLLMVKTNAKLSLGSL